MIYDLKQFRPYVLGHLTAIRSDHAALSFLKRRKDSTPVEQLNEADAVEKTEPKRVATATRSRAQNRPESGMVEQTEPGQNARLAAGSPQDAHDLSSAALVCKRRHLLSRLAGEFPGQSSRPVQTDRGRRRRLCRWNCGRL